MRTIGALLIFVSTYSLLYGAYASIPDRVLADTIYFQVVSVPGALTINWLTDVNTAHAVANRIESSAATLEIIRGCDGAGVLFLLIAAILAVRGSLRRVLWGLAGAIAFVYLLNQIRIVVLYFAAIGQGQWFLPLHSYVFPTLFVVLALMFFLVWSWPFLAKSDEPANSR